MLYKDVTNSVSKFGGILFIPTEYNMVFLKAVAPMKVRVSLGTQNGLPPPPKPLQKTLYICHHIVTVYLFQSLSRHSLLCLLLAPESTWVEISTLTYETNTNC